MPKGLPACSRGAKPHPRAAEDTPKAQASHRHLIKQLQGASRSSSINEDDGRMQQLYFIAPFRLFWLFLSILSVHLLQSVAGTTPPLFLYNVQFHFRSRSEEEADALGIQPWCGGTGCWLSECIQSRSTVHCEHHLKAVGICWSPMRIPWESPWISIGFPWPSDAVAVVRPFSRQDLATWQCSRSTKACCYRSHANPRTKQEWIKPFKTYRYFDILYIYIDRYNMI